MMRTFGKSTAALAAMSLAVAPALAAEGAASSLSLRGATAAENESDLVPGAVIGLIGVAAIVAGAVIIVSDDDDADSN